MTRVLWQVIDADGDKALLTVADFEPGVLLTTTQPGVLVTPPAARSLRDALNAYLEESSTAEGWELP